MPKYLIDINDSIGFWESSKNYVADKLTEAAGKHVDIRMNSLGGLLDDGIDIRNRLFEHGDVYVHLYGLNASSTTVASLGAKKVLMDENGGYLIHKVSNWVGIFGVMNSDQIAEAIEKLKSNKEDNDTLDQILVEMYAKKTNLPEDKLKDILSKGGWITAKQAKEYGFVDELIPTGIQDQKMNFMSDNVNEKLAALNLPSLSPENFVLGAPTFLNSEEESPKWINRFLTELKSIFQPQKTNTVEQPKPVIMDKTEFAKLNGVLGVESITLTDGKVNLCEEQLDKLNQALADGAVAKEKLDKEKEELTNKVTELTDQIEALKEKPADDTPAVDPAGDKLNKVKTNLSGADLLAELPNL